MKINNSRSTDKPSIRHKIVLLAAHQLLLLASIAKNQLVSQPFCGEFHMNQFDEKEEQGASLVMYINCLKSHYLYYKGHSSKITQFPTVSYNQ